MTNYSDPIKGAGPKEATSWKVIVLQCQKPSRWRAIWQIVNTLGPYSLIWYLRDESVTQLSGALSKALASNSPSIDSRCGVYKTVHKSSKILVKH